MRRGFIQDQNDRIYSDGNGLEILSSRFNLNAGTLALSNISDASNPAVETAKLRLGGTLPTAYNSGVGVYLDGDGKALIGNSTGSRLQFDGGNLIMSASTFFLGGGGQFLSGSNGLLEISSSNFHLDNSGNVVMSGNVTATTGEIGGFTIDADEIKAVSTLILDSDTNNGEIK